MNRSVMVFAVLLVPCVSRPVAAQGFQGVVDVRITAAGPNGTTGTGAMNFAIKGNRTLVLTRMFGQEVHVLNDFGRGTRTVWMPVPPGVQIPAELQAQGATKGLKFELPLNRPPAGRGADSASGATAPRLTSLGTTETIAGTRCRDYEIESSNAGPATRLCLTTALGQFVFPGGPAAPGAPSADPEWSGALGAAGFPLRVWTVDGRNQWEVIRIVRQAVPDSVFTVPSGYLDMARIQRGGRNAP